MKIIQSLQKCFLSIVIGKSYIFAPAAPEIIKVFSITEAATYLNRADEQTLVLFDIDSTLTTPSDPYLQRQAIRRHQRIYQQYISSLTKSQYHILNHLIVMQSPSQLVESAWPEVIKSLQKQGAKTLALTSSKFGSVGSFVTRFSLWRHQELCKLGIDFSSTFCHSCIFDAFDDFDNNHPGIAKGIVCAGNKIEKGLLLNAILNALQWVPSMIIVIDDKLANLISCKNKLQADFPSITFIGIHYNGVEQLPLTTTDPSIFEEKISDLVKRAKLLSQH